MRTFDECFEDSDGCCVSVMRDCSDPDSPTVSSDCGIWDRVVHAWSAGPVGQGAPWASEPSEVIFDCCECREC